MTQHTRVYTRSRKTTPLHTYTVTPSSLTHTVTAMQTAPATPPSLAFFKGVVDGETGGWVVVGVGDGDGRQQLAGPGGGVAAVEGVHRQVVVHPQCHSVKLLNNKPVNPTVTSLVPAWRCPQRKSSAPPHSFLPTRHWHANKNETVLEHWGAKKKKEKGTGRFLSLHICRYK